MRTARSKETSTHTERCAGCSLFCEWLHPSPDGRFLWPDVPRAGGREPFDGTRGSGRRRRGRTMRLVDRGNSGRAHRVAAGASARQPALGTRLRLMLEQDVFDGVRWRAVPHVASWLERPTPDELRIPAVSCMGSLPHGTIPRHE